MARRPAEVFGHAVDDRCAAARRHRESHLCPFTGRRCHKPSRLIAYPMGVCSVEYDGNVVAICPTRFLENEVVFRDVAQHYFGTVNDIVRFDEVRLQGVGNFDHVLVKHAPLSSVVEDFVVVEVQGHGTTGTGQLVAALTDYVGRPARMRESYQFRLNPYDIWKRAYTQMLHKGLVMERWGQKMYWAVETPLMGNLLGRYDLGDLGLQAEHAVRFAVYDLTGDRAGYHLTLQQILSASTDILLQAFRQRPDAPSRSDFLSLLQAKLELRLGLALGP